MRFVRAILAGIAFIGSHSAFANEIDFNRLGAICRTTAAGGISPVAQSIANVAKKERDLFRGHVVDATGRILRFGNIEFEVDRAADGRPESRTSIPWHNVQRYWNSVSDNDARQDGNDAQSVVSYPNISGPSPTPPQRNATSLKTLLNTIRKLNIPDEAGDAELVREALRQSVIRASLSDVPWSGAFIASVLTDAGVSRANFRKSALHITYITDAVKRSLSDVKAEPSEALYRACDPFVTKARPGDLLCFHRDKYTPSSGASLHRSLMRDIAAGKSPISASHCDVVIETDRARKKLRSVGGNVQHAVTERTLNITEKEFLSPNQGAKYCEASGANARSDEANCNLNRQAWFVLLQVR